MIRTAEMMMDDRRKLREAIANNEIPLTLLAQAHRQVQVLDRSIIAALTGRQIFIQPEHLIDTDSEGEGELVSLRRLPEPSLPEPEPASLPSRSLFSYGPDHARYDYHEVDVWRTQCGHHCQTE